MAWTLDTVNQMLYATEQYTMPATGTGYSTEIDFLRMGPYGGMRWVRFAVHPSAISGSNLDIILYGAYESGGTKVVLKDALVTDPTSDDTEVATGTALDIWLYPMPYFYVSWLVDTSEAANTIVVRITAAAAAPAMRL